MSVSKQADAFRHDALFYRTDQTLATTAVSFIREGRDNGEVVFVSLNGHPVLPLLAALFGDDDSVRFLDRGSRARPVELIDQYKRAMDSGLRAGVPGYRAMGFTDLEESELGWVEWLRYEAACNQVFAGYPLRALCTWDLRRLSEEQASALRAAHTGLLDDRGWAENTEYVEPVALVSRPEHVPRPDPVQSGPPHYEAEVGPDLRHVRMEIYPVALRSELSRLKVDDFIKAVGGVVSNAWSHGRGPVRLRMWAQPHKLVCTVTDRGSGIGDPFLGYTQPARRAPGEPTGFGGLGMWAARQLSDTLDYTRTGDGFTVRVVSHD